MEMPMNSGVSITPAGNSKAGMVVALIALLAIGLLVGYFIGKSGSEPIATATPSGTVSLAPSPSATVEPTNTPVPVTRSTVFSNEYMTVTIPAGWSYSTAKSGAAINITKNNYILYINTRASQASGVVGGRFGEIAEGAPSADAVVLEWSGPCHAPIKVPVGSGYSRYDYYTEKSQQGYTCEKLPSDGSNVWYFSYMSKTGGYLEVNPACDPVAEGINPCEYVITMAYNSRNVNQLPKKGNATLNAMLAKMTSIANTLVIDPMAGWKTYTNTQYGYEFKYPADWLVFGEPDDPHIVSEDSEIAGTGIEIHTNLTKPADIDFYTYVQETHAPKPGDINYPSDLTRITFNGYRAVKLDHHGGEGPSGPGYIVEHNATSYAMFAVYIRRPEPETNQILSTFKFTK